MLTPAISSSRPRRFEQCEPAGRWVRRVPLDRAPENAVEHCVVHTIRARRGRCAPIRARRGRSRGSAPSGCAERERDVRPNVGRRAPDLPQRTPEVVEVREGSRASSSSTVARTSAVFTNRCTTPPRAHGEIVNITERCESTWSGPACASSSRMNTAVERQNCEWESASTMRPSARSLSAMHARGEHIFARAPAV